MFKTLEEALQVYHSNEDDLKDKRGAKGVIEIIVKDRNGNIVQHYFQPNIVKIFAKEMLSHRIPSSEIWNPDANSGEGGWELSGIDLTEEFSARYILFGASFDSSGTPLDVNDSRFYTKDPVTGTYVPIRLGPGAEYGGGLINAIPISEPNRPLKRVEQIGFQATFQPAGTPLLQSDVRGINNIVTLETTLRLEEYNGFGLTESDFFTITEVALAGGKKFNAVGACECDPKVLFLEGRSSTSGGGPLKCIANGSDVITIDLSETEVDLVKAGDQIKVVGSEDTAGGESIEQITPFYLVLSKAVGGRDIQLDRSVVDKNNNPISGTIGIYRSTLRLFSHRILNSPLKKSSSFEVTCRWLLIFS